MSNYNIYLIEVSSPKSSSDDELEGHLTRKHAFESTMKKASSRSWDKVYAIVRGNQMGFYRDMKTAKSAQDQFFRNEAPLDLSGATVGVADDYVKRKHVFRIRLKNGAEYLFQASDDNEMNFWLSNLRQHCYDFNEGQAARSQTLPAAMGQETKRRSFFTLKKK